jgi:hypothetical protein
MGWPAGTLAFSKMTSHESLDGVEQGLERFGVADHGNAPQARSKIAAMPWPPPMHMVSRP